MLYLQEGYPESILESIETGIITTDLEGNITTINRAAERLFCVSRKEVLGNHYSDIMAPVEWERLNRTVNYVRRTGQAYRSRDVEFAMKNGHRLVINPTISLLRNHKREVLGFAMLVEDVTEKRKLEKHLKQAEKLSALGEMAVGIAHEIRNPLGTVYGFASLILMESPADSPHRRYLEIIISETERLSRITQEMLDFARPPERKYEQIHLPSLLEKTLELVTMETHMYPVHLVKELSRDVPLIFGDKTSLKQVFINILVNALQAISAYPGEVKVTCMPCTKRNGVVVEVTDTGEGIPPELIDNIFDPFFTTKEKGTGLGLSVAHRIVSDHGGMIEVDSKPGFGTTFRVKLPGQEGGAVRGK